MLPRRVSVLVVTYDHADEIGACLDGVVAQGGGARELEIVVVDNASADGTPDLVAAHPSATLIANDRNEGFAAGVNAAFATSTGDPVLLLNPDCVMDPGCVDALERHLDAHPRTAVAAANLRNLDGTSQRFARRETGVRETLWTQTEVGRRLDQRFCASGHADRRRYEAEWAAGIDAPFPVDAPAAACVLARRHALEPVPLDPAMPLFFNDTALFRRLRGAGWRLDVVPAATAAHGYGTSHRRLDLERRRAEWVASLWRYSAPWPRRQRALLAAGLVADALAAHLMLATGRARPDTGAFARGTLGGFGVPGMPAPWLSEPAIKRSRA